MNEQEQGSGGNVGILERTDNRGWQIFVNESRIYHGNDNTEAHKVLSLCERIIYLTKADGKVQIDRDGEMSEREYFQGQLFGIPNSLAMQIDESIKTIDKFGS